MGSRYNHIMHKKLSGDDGANQGGGGGAKKTICIFFPYTPFKGVHPAKQIATTYVTFVFRFPSFCRVEGIVVLCQV